jgi:thiamine biosynthesis protein ThiS
MHITVNGTPRQMPAGQNLSDLVNTFCKQSKHVITELNGVIIPPHQWPGTPVRDGDILELVAFVGGG